MKILTRTLIILAAAAVVIGATCALSTTEWGSSLLGSGAHGEGHGRPDSFDESAGAGPGAFEPGEAPAGAGRQAGLDGGGSRNGRGFFLGETLSHLAVMGLITAAVIAVGYLLEFIKGRRKRRVAPEAT